LDVVRDDLPGVIAAIEPLVPPDEPDERKKQAPPLAEM
jgi:hypothetical protein